MNPLLAMFGDPIWQILTVILVLALPVGIMAVRTRDMHASADQKRRETRRVLLLCLIVFVLLSGGKILFHARQTSPPQVASRAFSSIPTRGPTAAPPPTSDPSPDPTPTPRLARSMTQVLTTFCDAITTQDYQTAWKQYARSLQQAHPEPETFAAWRKFTRCSIPDQSGDPSALTVLTLTFAAGSTDRFRRSGDVDYRLTMGVEDHAWKITGVCDILSEGCFAVSWGEKEVALILIITLRSPDLHLAARHQGFLTRLTLLVCLTLFLVLSAGVVLFHKVRAASTVGSEVMRPRAATASPHSDSLPTTPSSSPQPPPFPSLTPSPAQVLTTFCEAIERQDLNTAWEQYAKALQKERAAPPPFLVRITIVRCRVDVVSDTSATGLLLLKTIGPNGYRDDYERDFQFTLSVEHGAWKITQIARCLADSCLPDTTSIMP